jgi:gamma-glutamyltranspeptidase/glutathione hydrolase
MSSPDTRPVIMGTHGCVSSSHYLATTAGFEILQAGGNAIDAAVATGLALHVVEPHMNGIGGETPIILHFARERRTVAISGQGTAPSAATIEFFKKQKIDLIPGDGFLPATVPASFDSWITCLSQFGTMSLGRVIRAALTLAKEGFPTYPTLQATIQKHSQRFLREWPTTARIFLPGGKTPRLGEVLRQEELGKTLERLVDAEKSKSGDRVAGLRAARDLFYSGEIAKTIVDFSRTHPSRDATGRSHSSLLSLDDLAAYQTRVEDTAQIVYKGLTIHKCGPWSQGPVFLQQLRLLEGYNLKSMKHNSADYIHVLTEAAKLAFADRDRFYGDPLFADVPMKRLLSKSYANERRRLIHMAKASLKFQPGDGITVRKIGNRARTKGDTTHLDTVDAEGNMVSATPSGGWIWSSPIIEGLGFPLNTRAQMFSLQSGHPNCIAPHKRPRTTLSPSLVTCEDRPLMAFGTPGGDQQDQWTLQFFLNYVEFGMNLQAAIDVPTFHTSHFTSSFYPRGAHPGRLHIENRIPAQVVRELERRGHRVAVEDGWSNGRVTAVHYAWGTRVMSAAASSRYQTPYALGF